MQNLINQAPEVANAFRELTQSIDGYSPMELKTKELILIGIFTANKAVRGIDTHVRIALEAGATKEEIISSILYAMPIVGLPAVTLALEKAVEVIGLLQESGS